MFTIGQAVSTSDNDQVKAAGKDYYIYECETSVSMFLRQCYKKLKTRSLFDKFPYSFISTYSHAYTHTYTHTHTHTHTYIGFISI